MSNLSSSIVITALGVGCAPEDVFLTPPISLLFGWPVERLRTSPQLFLATDNTFLFFGARFFPPYFYSPEHTPKTFCPGLWECDVAELFIKEPGSERYQEFNLSPTGAWWTQAFEKYRTPLPHRPPTEVAISTRVTESFREVSLKLPLSELRINATVDSTSQLNLTAILGEHSREYFTFTKPCTDTPDFHHVALRNDVVLQKLNRMWPSFCLPALYPIVDCESQKHPLDFMKLLFESGVGIVQLRAKALADNEFFSLACSAVKLAKTFAPTPKVIINDRLDIAIASHADGLHVGVGDISPAQARSLLGAEKVLGVSTHNLKQVLSAEREKHLLDYIALGPIFETASKKNPDDVVGPERLAEAASQVSLPLVAIGGITTTTMETVFQAGAKSVAVIQDLNKATNLQAYVKLVGQLRTY